MHVCARTCLCVVCVCTCVLSEVPDDDSIDRVLDRGLYSVYN